MFKFTTTSNKENGTCFGMGCGCGGILPTT